MFPNPIEINHYADALETVPLVRYFGNTVYLVILNLIGNLISSSLVGYAFARYKAPGSKVLFALILGTMIPLFLTFKQLNLIGSFMPLWIPSFFGSAFAIFMLRQFFKTIPTELFDAAKIDGCSEFGQYWRIMLPLAKPALTTIAIFTFQFHWNNFQGPLIYINDQEKKTLALGLRDFYQLYTHHVEWQQLMAASTMMVLPVLLVFLFSQRYFIRGIAVTGLKG